MHAPRTHRRAHRGTTSHGPRAKWPRDTPQKQAQKSILTEKRHLFCSVYGLWLHHKHEDSGPRSVEPSRSPRFLGASQAKLRAPAPPPAQGPAAQSPSTLGSSLAALPPAFPPCRPCPAPAPHTWGPQQAPVSGHGHPRSAFLGANNRTAREAQTGVDVWPQRGAVGPVPPFPGQPAGSSESNQSHRHLFGMFVIKKAKFSNNKDKR